MRHLAVLAVGALLIAAAAPAGAGPFPAAGLSSGEGAAVVLAQAKKEETVTQKVTKKVKRAWKSVVGTKFDVSCPAFPQPKRSTCSETGSRDEARQKCIARNPLCWVSDAK